MTLSDQWQIEARLMQARAELLFDAVKAYADAVRRVYEEAGVDLLPNGPDLGRYRYGGVNEENKGTT